MATPLKPPAWEGNVQDRLDKGNYQYGIQQQLSFLCEISLAVHLQMWVKGPKEGDIFTAVTV